MMTPLTTVAPFTFIVCDLSGVPVGPLTERFVRCTEEGVPILEDLFEQAEIILVARKLEYYERYDVDVPSGTDKYYTHCIFDVENRGLQMIARQSLPGRTGPRSPG
jgi:hypothetical protein